MMPCCFYCKFWRLQTVEDGNCLVRPPQFSPFAETALPSEDPHRGFWPLTLASDWCAAFQVASGLPLQKREAEAKRLAERQAQFDLECQVQEASR